MTKYCVMCGAELHGLRKKYCSDVCAIKGQWIRHYKDEKESRELCKIYKPLVHREHRSRYDNMCYKIAIYCLNKQNVSSKRIGENYNRDHTAISSAVRTLEDKHKFFGDLLLDNRITPDELNKILLFPNICEMVFNKKITIEQAKQLKINIM